MSTLQTYNLKHPDASGDQIVFTSGGDINFDNGAVYLDSANNRLGVGTSTPDERLNVAGAVRVTSNAAAFTSSDGALIDWATDTMRLVAARNGANSSKINFVTYDSGAAVDAIRIDSDGKVGIGTTSPVSTVDCKGQLSISNSATSYWLFDRDDSDGRLKLLDSSTSTNERLAVDSSGRLLVGTSSSLDLNAPIQAASTAFGIQSLRYSTSATGTGGAIDLARSNTGTIGTTTAIVAGQGLGVVRFRGAGDGSSFVTGAQIEATAESGTISASSMPTRLVFSTNPGSPATGPTERMRISADGKVSIGRGTTNLASFTTGAYLKLSTGADTTTGDFSCESYAGNAGTRYHFGFSNPNGLVGSITTNSSATAYNTSSDYRLKENVVPLTGAADRVNQLQVHRFNFIADPDETVDGFLAHEAQAVVPECVTGTKDEVDDEGNPVYQGIDQSKLVPLLTAALQEALQKIETLEQRLNDAGIA